MNSTTQTRSLNVGHVFSVTWTLRFPAKEDPNTEKALFDKPIVLQYGVKAKY